MRVRDVVGYHGGGTTDSGALMPLAAAQRLLGKEGTIKHVAGQLERGTPLRVLLRGLAAERHGQLALDFHAAPDTP